MKFKTYILIGIVASTFALISVWVILARKKEKPLHLKYKLGGILISLFANANSGCSSHAVVSCYHPAPHETIVLTKGNLYNSGDTVLTKLYLFSSYDCMVFEINDSTSHVLQTGILKQYSTSNNCYFVLDSKYSGDTSIPFYKLIGAVSKLLIQTNSLVINE